MNGIRRWLSQHLSWVTSRGKDPVGAGLLRPLVTSERSVGVVTHDGQTPFASGAG